jgi:hypothetical protein
MKGEGYFQQERVLTSAIMLSPPVGALVDAVDSEHVWNVATVLKHQANKVCAHVCCLGRKYCLKVEVEFGFPCPCPYPRRPGRHLHFDFVVCLIFMLAQPGFSEVHGVAGRME